MSSDRSKPGPTIVGGQPAGKRDSQDGTSRNIETIVLKLASDESFRERFLSDRDSAIREAGIHPADAEMKILDSINEKELLATAGVLAPGKGTRRRRFLRAAATLAALSGVGALSCDNRAVTPEGIRPDTPPTALTSSSQDIRSATAPEHPIIVDVISVAGLSPATIEELSEQDTESPRRFREGRESPASATDTSSREGGETNAEEE